MGILSPRIRQVQALPEGKVLRERMSKHRVERGPPILV